MELEKAKFYKVLGTKVILSKRDFPKGKLTNNGGAVRYNAIELSQGEVIQYFGRAQYPKDTGVLYENINLFKREYYEAGEGAYEIGEIQLFGQRDYGDILIPATPDDNSEFGNFYTELNGIFNFLIQNNDTFGITGRRLSQLKKYCQHPLFKKLSPLDLMISEKISEPKMIGATIFCTTITANSICVRDKITGINFKYSRIEKDFNVRFYCTGWCSSFTKFFQDKNKGDFEVVILGA